MNDYSKFGIYNPMTDDWEESPFTSDIAAAFARRAELEVELELPEGALLVRNSAGFGPD